MKTIKMSRNQLRRVIRESTSWRPPSPRTTTITVPAHYEFSIEEDPDSLEDNEQTYNIQIVKTVTGDYEVTGEWANLESFVNDLTLGDPESMDDIFGRDPNDL